MEPGWSKAVSRSLLAQNDLVTRIEQLVAELGRRPYRPPKHLSSRVREAPLLVGAEVRCGLVAEIVIRLGPCVLNEGLDLEFKEPRYASPVDTRWHHILAGRTRSLGSVLGGKRATSTVGARAETWAKL